MKEMTKIKTWIVCYRPNGGGKESESGWETKEEAVKFMADSITEGHSLQDIKFNGRSVLAARVFALLRDAKVMLSKRPDSGEETAKKTA
jgi:hypothetical protein